MVSDPGDNVLGLHFRYSCDVKGSVGAWERLGGWGILSTISGVEDNDQVSLLVPKTKGVQRDIIMLEVAEGQNAGLGSPGTRRVGSASRQSTS